MKKTLLILSSLLIFVSLSATTWPTYTFKFSTPVQSANDPTKQTISLQVTNDLASPAQQFTGGRLGFRFPISATGLTSATYGQNYGALGNSLQGDRNFTNVSFLPSTNTFGGFYDGFRANVSGSSGRDSLVTFLLSDLGGVDDGYLYIGISWANTNLVSSIPANTTTTILTFDVPLSWNGPIEFTTTANDNLGKVLDAQFDYSILNAATNDLTNLGAIAGNGSFGVTTTDIGNQQSTGENLVIYPNPAKEKVTLQTQGGESLASISISDFSGRIVETIEGNGENTQTVNIAKLNPGTYFVKTITDKGSSIRKIIKQ